MSRNAQLATLFERWCDSPREEWKAALAELSDPELRERLSALLEADAEASRLFEAGEDGPGRRLLGFDLADMDFTTGQAPKAVGPFRIVRRIGAGAMGTVYEAEQDHPRRRVALKRPHPWARSEVALELFRFEAQALGQVSHPCIPVVYEAGEVDGTAYLTMELVDGVPLLEWVHRTNASLDDRLDVLIQVARAVGAAHAADLVHRDLKPANILVSDAGEPKLLDFGVAMPALAEGLQAAEKVGVGTPTYMSPEQARGEPVGAASDIHALGTVGYQLLTGRLPVDGGTLADIAAAKSTLPLRANFLEPELDPDVARVVERALQPDISLRPPTAEAWADDLERARAGEPLDWVPATPFYLLERFVRRHATAVLLVVGVLIAGAGVGIGAWAWQKVAQHQRDQLAAERLVRMQKAVTTALELDDLPGAERALRSFVDDPEHAWTPARAQAWAWWADQVVVRDPGQGLDALAEAWLAAPDAATSDDVGRQLARRFHEEARWSSLWRLRGALSPQARADVRPLLRDAATARRDFAGARAHYDPSDRRDAVSAQLFRALEPSQRLGMDAVRAHWKDLQQDGVPELVANIGELIVIKDALARTDHGALDLPASVGEPYPQLFETVGEWTWLVSPYRGGRLMRFRLQRTDRGDGTQLAVHHETLLQGMNDARLHDLEAIETPDGLRLAVATAYPAREVVWLDPEAPDGAAMVPSLHPPTDALSSDIMAIEPFDLDADGDQEVIVSIGAWAADEVRVLTPTEPGEATDGESQRYRVAGRLRLGTVNDLLVLPMPDGPPKILATKADLEGNLRMYPADAPFGRPAGVYLLGWTGDALEVEQFFPIPVRDGVDSGPEKLVHHPCIGDFDGDGKRDAAFSIEHMDHGTDHLAWIVSDLHGEAVSHILNGIQPQSAADIDFDGDDELLVLDEHAEVWVMGAGDAVLPIWDQEVNTVELGPPPTDEPMLQRGWQRAEQLVSLGLAPEATAGLSVLPGLSDSPDAQSETAATAARLFEAAGKMERARELYTTGIARRPDDPALWAGLVRTHVALGELPEARDAHRKRQELGGSGSEWAWLDDIPDRVRLLDGGSLEGWALEQPGVFTQTDEGLHIEAYNDQGVLATRNVVVDDDVVGIDIHLSIDAVELGAGIGVELVPADGRLDKPGVAYHPGAMLAVWGQGGGGITKLYQNCGGQAVQTIGSDRIEGPLDVRMSVHRMSPVSTVRCRVEHTQAGTRRLPSFDGRPLEPGLYTLRLKAWGVPSYDPPTRISATLHSLTTIGLDPVERPRTPAQLARAALFAGQTAEGLPPEELAWRHLANGDIEGLRTALTERWTAGDRRRIKWLIRSAGADVVPLLPGITGDAFPELFRDAWSEMSDPLKRTTAVETELLRPIVTDLPASDPAGRSLRLVRADIRARRGQRARARALARSVLDSDPSPEQAIDAWLVLARTATNDEEARVAARKALELDPTGYTATRIERSPPLANLITP